MIKKFRKTGAIITYLVIGRYLPVSYSPLAFGLTKPLRAALCRYIFKKCGKNVNIERGALFGNNIEIGDNSGIGIDALLDSTGGIIIGNNVMMGPDVMIFTQNHAYEDINRPMIEQGSICSPVIIEDDVWIGARVIILPGTRIGKSAIIGAGAVVASDVPPFSVVGGNPARILKTRRIPV